MLELVDEVDSKSIASNGVRVRFPPPAPASSRTAYRSRRRFFVPNKRHLSLTSSLLLSKLNPLRWASIWGFISRKVRSASFPATACGYCQKLRSLPCASSQIRSTRLRICFFALLFVPLLLLYKLNPRGELWRCKDDQKLRSRRL